MTAEEAAIKSMRAFLRQWDTCDATVCIPPFEGSRQLFECVGAMYQAVDAIDAQGRATATVTR